MTHVIPQTQPRDPLCRIRAGRLARALQSFGIGERSEVVVLCCPTHWEDDAVAMQALASLGATPVRPSDWTGETLEAVAGRRPVMQLACGEGAAAWRAIGGRGIMIGDGENTLWWKALECRYAEVA